MNSPQLRFSPASILVGILLLPVAIGLGTVESYHLKPTLSLVSQTENHEAAMMTSIQAAQAAYAEIVKTVPNAVLQRLEARSNNLDSNWEETDAASNWVATYTDEDHQQTIKVHVALERVEVDTNGQPTLIPKVSDAIPKDVPKISMSQAAQVALLFGAPADQIPTVKYMIDSPRYTLSGKPVWELQYLTSGKIFVIDAMSGDIVEQINLIDYLGELQSV